jgi:chromosome segregation ATPase
VSTAQNIVEIVFWLFDRERSGFVTGANFVVDGGMTLCGMNAADRASDAQISAAQVQALNGPLIQAGEETKAVESRRDAAVHALSGKEFELARLATALNERPVLADSRKGAALTTQIQALNERLTQAGEETRAVEERHNAAVRALSEKESELARVTNALDEGSALADSQKGEITSLTIQVQTLKEELGQARERTTVAEDPVMLPFARRNPNWLC